MVGKGGGVQPPAPLASGLQPYLVTHGLAPSADEEIARKLRETTIEIVMRSYDKASAYANLIILAGYAGAFGIWSFTRNQMSPRGAALVALLVGVSLVVFVIFEIYKMTFTVRLSLAQRAVLIKSLSAAELLKEIQLVSKNFDALQMKQVMPIWGAVLIVTVVTALGGIGLIFYSCIATLLDFPQWP